MDAEQHKKLASQVKRKLNITWDDQDTDARIADMATNAVPTLAFKLGVNDTAFDWSDAGQENLLIVNYCFYEWNHAANEFDAAYSDDIAQVRAKWEVKQFEEEVPNV